jgi:hypothetical protein
MTNLERAIRNINTLINNGSSLKEAILETSWEFGIVKSELWEYFS